jgi:hypothetical protein
MFIIGCIAITLEIILLLIWIYQIFLSPNGTDPAGQGIAMVFLLGLIAYIAGGIALLLLRQTWSMLLVLIMAAIPLGIVGIGLWKQYGTGRKKPY